MAAKARAVVADEVVELCNEIIRRGNDIVTHIDMYFTNKFNINLLIYTLLRIEDTHLRHYSQCENELKIQYDKMKRVNLDLINMVIYI